MKTKTPTREDLDRLISIYKNGLNNWPRDQNFLLDCAYYEGAIKKGSEILGIEQPFKWLDVLEEESLKTSYQTGYDNFWSNPGPV